jgi:hypothetical protein
MRFNLNVPYAEKDQAKQLGARWDAARKVWYIDGRDDLAPFARWAPSEHTASSDAPAPAATSRATGKAKPAKPTSAGGQVCVGSRYVAPPRVCDCAPWEECERCRAYALAG